MRYYSTETREFYNSEKECLKAEREYLEKRDAAKKEKEKQAAERKARAAEVEDARKAMIAAQKKYREVLGAFVKQFGSYHYSTTNTDEIPTLFSMFDSLFF